MVIKNNELEDQKHRIKTLFGFILVFGRKQLTYKGWPLYYFGQDAMVMGSNKGIHSRCPVYGLCL